MSVISKAALIAEIDAWITTNGNDEITGAQLNKILKDLIDSGYAFIVALAKAGLTNYIPTDPYVIGNTCVYNGSVYICTGPTTGTFDPTKWQLLVFPGGTTDQVLAKLSNADGDFYWKTIASGNGGTPTIADKWMIPNDCSTDNADTGLTITDTPANHGNVTVVLGIHHELGNGVKTKDCYFSNDAGVTARLIADIQAGDKLFWNAIISEIKLTNKYKVNFYYNK